MNDQDMVSLCPDEEIQSLLAEMREPDSAPLPRIEALTRTYPSDPRLHFLQGSQLAEERRFTEAVTAMRRAVEVAPDFVIARFQLGFLLLTSGDADSALEVWGPLHRLPADHYLLHFVRGLTHLINDAFDQAIEALERGIACNDEILPLNHDMQMIVDESRRKLMEIDGDGGMASSAHQLLQQAALKSIKH